MYFQRVIIVFCFIIVTACSSVTSQHIPSPHQGETPSLVETTQTEELLADLPPVRTVNLYNNKPRVSFARFGQCQLILPIRPDRASGLFAIPIEYEDKINQCLELARKEKINVLILPELALAFPKSVRKRILEKAQKIAAQNDMVIIAGSFYDAQRFNRIAIVSNQGLELGYKIRPSRFEASPRFGLGMRPGESLLVLNTRYGTLAIVTCVDLISDAVQYILRNLATRGVIDVIININYNPASWEFLVEANSIARRHPVFIAITNVAGPNLPDKLSNEMKKKCFPNGQLRDNGTCYGNSALFGNVRIRKSDWPNSFKVIEDFVADHFKVKPNGSRSIPYDVMLANIPPFEEAMLVYELNLRMKQEPSITNAPDQGYPTIRGLKKIKLK